MTKFFKGMRVRLSKYGIAHIGDSRTHTKYTRGIVTSKPQRPDKVTVLRDGLRYPDRYAARFWEPDND